MPLNTYFAFGPSDSFVAKKLTDLLGGDSSLIQPVAGPSGLGWPNGPEFRPVNDMDYDFDVPLPAPPAGAQSIQVSVVKHPEDTTGVQQQITYTNPDANGLPTTAHIHLPYKGADNGIYGRTYYFYWDKFNPPGNHFQVKLDHLFFTMPTFQTALDPYFSGRTIMWADVCGQWTFLTGVNPTDFLLQAQNKYGDLHTLPPFDVFLDPGDTLRVFSQGYDQEPFDSLFGVDVPKTAYNTALDIAEAAVGAYANTFGASIGENRDLGGALFDATVAPNSGMGEHATNADTAYFFQDFFVNYVPRPPVLGVVGAPVDFGLVCFDRGATRTVEVHALGESALTVTGVSVSGAGYSVSTPFPVPFFISGGQFLNLTVSFHPTSINDGAGTLTIQTNDPLQPIVTYNLKASPTLGFPRIDATANTARTPTLVFGATTTWTVTIMNIGMCKTLTVTPSISGTGFSILLPASYYDPATHQIIKPISVPAGGTNTDLTVKFTAPSSLLTKAVGTLTLASNDTLHPTTTLTFGAEVVPVGMRVLVVGADGTPYPSVDDLQIKNPSKEVNTHLKDVPLVTIDPPASWKRIQYHYMTALAPTDDGSTYELRVQVGNKKQTLTFTLGAEEFKQLVITLP